MFDKHKSYFLSRRTAKRSVAEAFTAMLEQRDKPMELRCRICEQNVDRSDAQFERASAWLLPIWIRTLSIAETLRLPRRPKIFGHRLTFFISAHKVFFTF